MQTLNIRAKTSACRRASSKREPPSWVLGFLLVSLSNSHTLKQEPQLAFLSAKGRPFVKPTAWCPFGVTPTEPQPHFIRLATNQLRQPGNLMTVLQPQTVVLLIYVNGTPKKLEDGWPDSIFQDTKPESVHFQLCISLSTLRVPLCISLSIFSAHASMHFTVYFLCACLYAFHCLLSLCMHPRTSLCTFPVHASILFTLYLPYACLYAFHCPLRATVRAATASEWVQQHHDDAENIMMMPQPRASTLAA